MAVFVIAEVGSTWELDLEKLKRLAYAIRDCGADAMKLQWTSSGVAMAKRRGLGEDAAAMYYKWLQYDPALLVEAKSIAEAVGLEFMCTVYLPQDIAVVAPLVTRFKVSAYEAAWHEFLIAHPYPSEVIVSVNPGTIATPLPNVKRLFCISKYPTPIEDLHLSLRFDGEHHGFSDHTANVLTGAAAVAAGASIVEAHIKLHDTPKDNPDYPHSLIATPLYEQHYYNSDYEFSQYVSNIRTVEKML